MTTTTYRIYLRSPWSIRFVPYLCIDPEPDPNPGARDDAEEDIQVLRVPVSELKRMIRGGVDMMLPSITTSYMALEALQENGLLT